ncbi:MAG: ATP-dependent Clp protease ATP-binding subunit, partial [Verrucomicrobiaceae bacterium]
FLHGSPEALARFDMGEYGHEDSLKRLIGEDRTDPGLLGQAIDARPEGGILLLDEIEKAHPKISRVFLGATDAARVTGTDGVTRRLDRWYLIFTSNLGSASAAQMTGVPHKMVERTVIAAATRFFSPETMARFTGRIVFSSLGYATQREIAENLAACEARHFERVGREKGLCLQCSVTPAGTAFLVRHGHTREMGARPMRDAVERLMGGPFARWLLGFESECGVKKYFLEFDATEGAAELSLNVQAGEDAEEESEKKIPPRRPAACGEVRAAT